jgi:FtsZ-binding cell division protein ZapB
MIYTNFTINEVLKLPSLTLEELKEYVYNLDTPSLQQQIKDLKDELQDLEDKRDELQDRIYELGSDY